MLAHLRSGKMHILQEKLKDARCLDKYMMLEGASSMYDHSFHDFKEAGANFSRFNEEEMMDDHEMKTVEGNKNYLNYMLTCYKFIDSMSSKVKNSDVLQRGIFGILCGDYPSIVNALPLLCNGRVEEHAFLNKLWAYFKCYS